MPKHRFYCGVDLHARTLALCVLDADGQVAARANVAAAPDAVLDALAPFREDLAVACECMFAWYWLADLDPAGVQPGHGRFVFVPASAVDEIDGCVLVEAAGPPGLLRVVSFTRGETDEGLDVAQPVVVEGVLVMIRHSARGQFPSVVELQVQEARRVQ